MSGKVPGEAEKWDDVIRKITSVWTPEVAAEVLAAITQLDLRATPSVGNVPTFDGAKFVPQAPAIAAAEVTFTETTGAGTYTGTVVVPAGATIVDLVVVQVAQWTAATSATLKVGDAGDDDGFISNMNLKTYPAGQSESALAFNNSGAYVSQVLIATNRYSASSHTITGVVTTVGTTGNAGRTRLLVLYALATPTAASKA